MSKIAKLFKGYSYVLQAKKVNIKGWIQMYLFTIQKKKNRNSDHI